MKFLQHLYFCQSSKCICILVNNRIGLIAFDGAKKNFRFKMKDTKKKLKHELITSNHKAQSNDSNHT